MSTQQPNRRDALKSLLGGMIGAVLGPAALAQTAEAEKIIWHAVPPDVYKSVLAIYDPVAEVYKLLKGTSYTTILQKDVVCGRKCDGDTHYYDNNGYHYSVDAFVVAGWHTNAGENITNDQQFVRLVVDTEKLGDKTAITKEAVFCAKEGNLFKEFGIEQIVPFRCEAHIVERRVIQDALQPVTVDNIDVEIKEI